MKFLLKLKQSLKEKWEIKTEKDFWLIMLTFSLAGLFVSWGRRPVFHWMGLDHDKPFWLKALVYIPLICPLYQMGLLFFGALLGQFSFILSRQKAILQRLRSGNHRPSSNKKIDPKF